MALAIFAKVFAIGIDDGGCVVVNTGALDLIDRHDEHDPQPLGGFTHELRGDRKSTRLNSSHLGISYAVFCLKKTKQGREVCALLSMRPSAESARALRHT